MTKKISEIKEELATIPSSSDTRFKALSEDKRSGVQLLLQRKRRQWAKETELFSSYEKRSVYEKQYLAKGKFLIAGLDEVGRGPLAGPVVAAAVILDPESKILGLNDSKQLSEKKRIMLAKEIKEKALYYSVSKIEERTIDKVNILEATKLAMLGAIAKLPVQPEILLIDALNLSIDIPQEKIIKGDTKSNSIAAASILAKVTRDQIMCDYAKKYPAFQFEKNAGYGTQAHLKALKKFGKTPIHRESFAPVKETKIFYQQ